MTSILSINGLMKRYGNTEVLKGVGFELMPGHILGLLGRNGAGKTTMMKCLLGLNAKYDGDVFFQGQRLNMEDEKVKNRIGSLVDVKFFEDMTAYENMTLAAGLMRMPRQLRKENIDALLDFVDLTGVRNKKVRKFSFGMKQRLALAQSLLGEPVLLILDEPFVGLDPIGIEQTKAILTKLCRERGTSIIFSSHQMAEVGALADDIIVLSGGVIAYADSNENIRKNNISLMDLMR